MWKSTIVLLVAVPASMVLAQSREKGSPRGPAEGKPRVRAASPRAEQPAPPDAALSLVEMLARRPKPAANARMVLIRFAIAQATLREGEKVTAGNPASESHPKTDAGGKSPVTAMPEFSLFDSQRLKEHLQAGDLSLRNAGDKLESGLTRLAKNAVVEAVSRGQLVTLDGQPAFVQVGQREPRITGSLVSPYGRTNTITMVNVGMIAGFTPHVHDNGRISLQADVENTQLGRSEDGVVIHELPNGEKLRATSTQMMTVQTAVTVAPGQTVALAGVVNSRGNSPRTEVLVLVSADLLDTAQQQATKQASHTTEVQREPQAASREKQITNSIGMKLTLIPAGEFLMGSGESAEETAAFFNKNYGRDFRKADHFKDEHPQHRVRITKPFYLGTYHVTRGQFRQFVEDSGYKTDAEKGEKPGAWGWDPDRREFVFNERYSWRNVGFKQTDEHPVVTVSWNDAAAFCKWLSRKEGHTYRLPTEAEWEYACRAGTTTRYHTGDDPATFTKARFPDWPEPTRKASECDVFTFPVGTIKPNAFGLYDTHGNAWQWCADWYGAEYYAKSLENDPTGPDSGRIDVRRGGSWLDWPYYSRSAERCSWTPEQRGFFTGFRVARTQ